MKLILESGKKKRPGFVESVPMVKKYALKRNLDGVDGDEDDDPDSIYLSMDWFI